MVDHCWTSAYRDLCHAQLMAKQEGLPKVGELINSALDKLQERAAVEQSAIYDTVRGA